MTKLGLKFLFLAFLLLLCPSFSYASWSKYQNNPVLNIDESQSWESNSIDRPMLILENNVFKMWYAGNSGGHSHIGYAESNDGLVFTRYVNNPVIQYDIFNSGDIGVDSLSVVRRDKYYAVFARILNNPLNFTPYYTSSNDGLNWDSPTLILFDTTNTWDSQYKASPEIIYDPTSEKYKLWYTARGVLNGVSRWRVGHATSTDGVNWIKNPLPVLDASAGWEGPDVGDVSILLEDGVYSMWYHGQSGIGQATSTDGISWTKDPNNPILIPDPGGFDSKRVLKPSVVKKDNIYYLYYAGIGNDDKWRIGLATSESLPSPTTTPVITATPTVLPISPTATPPAPSESPIVIVVGMGGSWNAADIPFCTTDISNTWTINPFIRTYNRLIQTLKNAGLQENSDFYVYTYDWRQVLPKQADMFQSYIAGILQDKPPGTKATIVAHSFGGLVARSYMDKNPSTHDIDRLLTVGTPHQGTVLAYPLWADGKIMDEPLVRQALLAKILSHCKDVRGAKYSNREIVQHVVPSIQQLLPIFPYIRRYMVLTPEDQMINRNNWLLGHPIAGDLYGTQWKTLSGFGEKTLQFLDVLTPKAQDTKNGNWLDGAPVDRAYSIEGDNTVLNQSSRIDIPDQDNIVITDDHQQVMYSDEGIGQILSFLNMTSAVPAAASIVPEDTSDRALSIFTDHPAEMILQPPKNKPAVLGEDNLLIVYEPDPGSMTLTIIPKTTDTYHLSIDAQEKGKEPESVSLSLNLKKNQPSTLRIQYRENGSNTLKVTPQ